MSARSDRIVRAQVPRQTSQVTCRLGLVGSWLLGSCLIAASALMGCGEGETTTVPRTQLTVRLYASQEVFDGMTSLRVSTYAGSTRIDDHTFGKGELTKWPIDLPITPVGDNDSSAFVEFVAEAVDAAGKSLVQQRALASFVPREKHVLEVFLARCGALQLGQLCEQNPLCRGDKCLTCAASASCAPTPATPGATLPALSLTELPVPKSAPWEDAAAVPIDGGPVSAPDSGLDAGVDAGPDAAAEAGADASLDAAADAGEAGAPQWEGGTFWCGNSFFWSPATAAGPLPAGAPVLAMPEITPAGDGQNPGARNQHVCRITQADGSTVSGKANAFASGPNVGRLDYGCYFALYTPETNTWKGEGVDNPGVKFDVYTPPDMCKFSWIPTTAGKLVPNNSLTLAADARFQKYFACRFEVTQPESTGLHIGRVSKNLGDLCRMQFWGKVLESANYEILVQDFPPAENVHTQ